MAKKNRMKELGTPPIVPRKRKGKAAEVPPPKPEPKVDRLTWRGPVEEKRMTGTDGNAFAVIAKVSAALRKAKVPEEELKAFRSAAMSGDYGNVLRTCMEWVNVS